MPLAHGTETLGLLHTERSTPGRGSARYQTEVFIKSVMNIDFRASLSGDITLSIVLLIVILSLHKPLNYSSCSFFKV